MALNVPCPMCRKATWPDCGCQLPPGPPDPEPPAETARPRKRVEVVKLRRERRCGRDVIVIEGLPGDVDLAEYASSLKRRCASGGTVKGRAIEIQGDHRKTIERFLEERGFRSKRAGG